MMILISKNFMSIEEYNQIYLTEVELFSDAEEVFPIKPSLLKNLEFLEIDEYNKFTN